MGRTKAWELVYSGTLHTVTIGRSRRVPISHVQFAIRATRRKSLGHARRKERGRLADVPRGPSKEGAPLEPAQATLLLAAAAEPTSLAPSWRCYWRVV